MVEIIVNGSQNLRDNSWSSVNLDGRFKLKRSIGGPLSNEIIVNLERKQGPI